MVVVSVIIYIANMLFVGFYKYCCSSFFWWNYGSLHERLCYNFLDLRIFLVRL